MRVSGPSQSRSRMRPTTSGGAWPTTLPADPATSSITLTHEVGAIYSITISGLVHNPAAGDTIDELDAHVRVFDAAGILIATRSAPVSLTAVPPGADAPFTVTFGDASTATRYRVSFASRGTMLAHVDRRTNLPAAVTADAR